jgi:outer membrane protein
MMKQIRVRLLHPVLLSLAVSCAVCASAQTAAPAKQLPDAPPVRAIAELHAGSPLLADQMSQADPANNVPADQTPRLTQAEAEQMALKNNPRISVAHLLALAQHQVVREYRSADLPTFVGSITAEKADRASRISAGDLTSSRLFTHAGAGGNFTQLITDFGRTHNLVASSKLQERARNAQTLATQEDIVLAADQAFFNALQAQALLKVAEQNVETRNTTDQQIGQMTKNKLRSTLDMSFADVNLSQAKLLLLDAKNNVDSSMAALDDVLGLDHEVRYTLVRDDSPLQPPPPDSDQLTRLALTQRPDLQALNFQQQAAMKFSRAQHDQMLPTISAMGTVGSVPVRPDTYYTTNWWGAIAGNINVPIFNGFLFSAESKEANFRAQAASQQSRVLRDQIVQDVRTAWLATATAYQRVTVTEELLKEANLALGLAQTRYQLGLSSIVELSQAQYQQTDAAITNTNSKYQYRLSLATLNYQIGVQP